VAYLGHVITGADVAMDESKIEAVKAWPIPKTIRALRGFLGLTGYYRCFIHNYGIIAAPLTALLKKEAFRWSDDATAAFNALKAPDIRTSAAAPGLQHRVHRRLRRLRIRVQSGPPPGPRAHCLLHPHHGATARQAGRLRAGAHGLVQAVRH